MKTFKLNLLGLALAGLILGACSQTGTYENADLMNEQAAANKAGFNLNPFGSGENARTYAADDCTNHCIDPLDPEYSYQQSTISNNSGPNTRVFTYEVNNTLTGFDVAWSYAATNAAGRKLRITVSGAGFSSSQTHTSPQYNGSNAGGTHTFTFNSAWAACGVVTVVAEILEGAAVLSTNTTTYNLIGECVVDCEDEFSAVLDCTDPDAKTLTVTFTAENAGDYVIQGGLTAGAVIGSSSATAGFEQNTLHRSWTGPNPARVTRWEGSLDECETVTVTITYSGGAGVGSWSAKSIVDGVEVVNGESEDQDCD